MKRLLSLALVIVLVLGAFAGCGGGGDDTDANVDPAEKVLKVRKSRELVSTDYALTTTSDDMALLWTHVFQGLYGIDEAGGDYRKELAKEVVISEDGLEYTIDLVEAKFANGEDLKASDVKFSYDRAMANSRFNYVTNMIDKVEEVDEDTVKITLQYPYSPFIHTLFTVRICSEKEVTEAGEAFGTVPNKAGTGPYYVDQYDPAGNVVLKANENHYAGAPDIKTVEFVVITDDAAAVIAYENDEIDFMTNAPTAEWDALVAASNGNNAILKGNNIRAFYINQKSETNNGILQDENVRKAICYAIDKDAINTVVAAGLGNPTTEFIPSSYVATAPKEDTFETYPYSPEKAKEMLYAAGFTDADIEAGIDVGTIITYGASTAEKAKAAQVIQSNLKAVGLIAQVDVQDNSIIVPRLHEFDYDLGIYADSGNYNFNNIRQQIYVDGGYQCIDYSDSDVLDYEWAKDMLQQAVEITDTEQRLAIYTELWKAVMDTATIYPYINLPVGVVWADDVEPGDAPFSPTYYHLDTMSWK